jgi:transposase
VTEVTEVTRRNGCGERDLHLALTITDGRMGRAMFAPVQIAAAVEMGEENSKPASEDDRRMCQLQGGRTD